MRGRRLRRPRKSDRGITSASTGSSVVTVVERGLPSIAASSPISSPGPDDAEDRFPARLGDGDLGAPAEQHDDRARLIVLVDERDVRAVGAPDPGGAERVRVLVRQGREEAVLPHRGRACHLARERERLRTTACTTTWCGPDGLGDALSVTNRATERTDSVAQGHGGAFTVVASRGRRLAAGARRRVSVSEWGPASGLWGPGAERPPCLARLPLQRLVRC